MDALKDVIKSREYIGKQKRKVLENQDTVNEECQLQQQDVYNNHWNYKYMDRPGTMANGTALLFYIATMVGGCIFKDRYIIWIVATIVYVKFRTRHQ
nr:MAG TPA: hypothetical protein [Caudoviricetes sp.]